MKLPFVDRDFPLLNRLLCFLDPCINPYKTNELAHHYHLDETTFSFRGLRSDFVFLSHFFRISSKQTE